MIRSTAIKRLLKEKVAPHIQQILEPLGYKYKKTQMRFVHKDGIAEKVIWLKANSKAIAYDAEQDEIRLQFDLKSSLLLSKFDNWYQKEIGNKIYTHLFVQELANYWILEESDLSDADFYEPTAAQKFKQQVTQYLRGKSKNEFFCFNAEALGLLKEMNQSMIQAMGIHQLLQTDIQITYNNLANQPFNIKPHLLCFVDRKVEAKQAFDEGYNAYMNEIKLHEEDDSREAQWSYKLYRKMLEQLIQDAKQLIDQEYPNPFGELIQLKSNENRVFDISPKLQFNEFLRFDMSGVTSYHYTINTKGETLFWVRDQGLFKFNSVGKLVFKAPLELKDIYPFLGYVEELDLFYVNNYLLSADHQLLELPLPKKGKKIWTRDICLLDYDSKHEQFLAFYRINSKKGLFCIYDKNYQLLHSMELEGYIAGFVPEKEWVIIDSGKTHQFYNYKGELVFELKYKNGNSYFQLSPDHRYFLSHFYSTKSDWHDLEKGTSSVIWGHPTYVKGYKNQLYSDIFNNFGLMRASFSTDGKYLVGAADHGKYVAWELPQLKRIELFPNQKTLEQLEHAEILELNNEKFLKNRNNTPMAIHMLEGGDYFFMEFKNHIWVWDRNFQQLHTFENTGRMSAKHEQFLIGQTAKELIIYKKN